MTHTERLILENQIAIMRAISDMGEISRYMASCLSNKITNTESHLNESDGDGGH